MAFVTPGPMACILVLMERIKTSLSIVHTRADSSSKTVVPAVAGELLADQAWRGRSAACRRADPSAARRCRWPARRSLPPCARRPPSELCLRGPTSAAAPSRGLCRSRCPLSPSRRSSPSRPLAKSRRVRCSSRSPSAARGRRRAPSWRWRQDGGPRIGTHRGRSPTETAPAGCVDSRKSWSFSAGFFFFKMATMAAIGFAARGNVDAACIDAVDVLADLLVKAGAALLPERPLARRAAQASWAWRRAGGTGRLSAGLASS